MDIKIKFYRIFFPVRGHKQDRTNIIYHIFLALLCLVIPAQLTRAEPVAKGQHYDARIAVRSQSAQAGSPLKIAFVIRPQPGWHIYWSNPGDSGYAPTFNWTLPKGMTADVVHHPVPQQLVLDGIASNVHEGETILLQNLSVPATFKTGQILILGVDLDILTCSESSCVPDPLHLDLTLPVGQGQINPAEATLFKDAARKIPLPAQTGALFNADKDNIRIFIPQITRNDGDKIHLFGTQKKAIREDAGQKFSAAKSGLIITVPRGEEKIDKQFSGVLRIDRADGVVQAYAFDALAAEHLPAVMGSNQSQTLDSGFFLALGAAILGGLLLNLMPCVFPILSLKALALSRAGGNDHEAKEEAIGYSIGAIGVIMSLGATLLLLRGGGQELGWAFQLQDTRVVIILLLLVTAISLNMTGVFELPTLGGNSRENSGFMGALSTGALAAFIATPCTGPFMASALAAAMLLPAAAAMAIFFGLGLGLALPFLALGFIKPLRKWLPKPGAWMQKLRQILSIPMFITALGLVWIVGRQAGVDVMAGALGAALLLSISLWWYGLRQFSGKKMWPVAVPLVVSVILALNLINLQSTEANAEAKMDALHVEPFSKARLSALKAEHAPVFLYLTADWCLSCKVNEATSLSSGAVAKTFDKAGVTVMRGDWTTGDPEITGFLKEIGSAGVPVYLWYSKDGSSRRLPQILTPTMLTDLIDP